MKKLIVMLAAAAIAASTQAAYVAWTLTNVAPGGTAATQGLVYMFFEDMGSSTSRADTSWVSALEGKGATAVASALSGSQFQYNKSDVPNGLGANAGTFTYNASTIGSGNSLPSNEDLGLTGANNSHKYSVYAVIFDSDTITDESKFMVTSATAAQTVMGNSAGTTKAYSLGSQAGATWYAVTDVPEPTSGLLMLVGLGALALRRRRA